MEKEYEIKGRNYKIDTEKASRKWAPVLDALKAVDPEIRQFMAIYAEYHQLESYDYDSHRHGMGGFFPYADPPADGRDIGQNLLPMSMKVLSKLNLSGKTFDIMPRLEQKEYGITLSHENKKDIEAATGMDIVQKMENKLVEALVTDINRQLETKNTIYIDILVKSISLMAMEEFTPKMLMNSRYKII